MEYEEKIGCDGTDEEITIRAVLPVGGRLAQLIERSAIRDFDATYDEETETITIEGSIVHGA